MCSARAIRRTSFVRLAEARYASLLSTFSRTSRCRCNTVSGCNPRVRKDSCEFDAMIMMTASPKERPTKSSSDTPRPEAPQGVTGHELSGDCQHDGHVFASKFKPQIVSPMLSVFVNSQCTNRATGIFADGSDKLLHHDSPRKQHHWSLSDRIVQ